MTDLCFVSLPAYGYFNEQKYEQTGGGGAKRQIHLLSRALCEFHDVSVVVGDYGQPKYERRDNVGLFKSYRPGETSSSKAFLKLFQAMKRADSDIYIYRGRPQKAAFVGVIASLLKKKWAYHISNDADLKSFYDRCSLPVQWLFRYNLKRAHVVIAQTDHQQRELRVRFGVDSVVIPNGYPQVEGDTTNDLSYFLWVGRLNEDQKRPHLYLNCAEKLPDYQFRLAGMKVDDEYSEEVIRQIESLDNVQYLGSVSPDEIHKQYKNAIALVNTSAYEGFPNTFLEAWRNGVPVVSLTVNPRRYLDDDLYSGYADDELKQMRRMLQSLSNDAEYRRHVGKELQDFFELEYDIDKISRIYSNTLINKSDNF